MEKARIDWNIHPFQAIEPFRIVWNKKEYRFAGYGETKKVPIGAHPKRNGDPCPNGVGLLQPDVSDSRVSGSGEVDAPLREVLLDFFVICEECRSEVGRGKIQ